MENEIALFIIICITLLSKRTLLPMTMISFYIMYMSLDSHVFDGVSDQAWYLMNAVIDLTVLLLCLAALSSGEAYVKTTFLFMIYICMFYLIPDLAMALSVGQTFESWAVSLYAGVMNLTLMIDILFCIVGSDNRLSRMLIKGE